MTASKHTPNWSDAQLPLQAWYSTSLGESILTEMRTLLNGMLPDIFGYQGVQVGQISQNFSLLESAGLHKKLILGTVTDSSGIDIGADALNLPIASQTMHVVVLPHTLDFCSDPHQALREADRVLTNDGHLVLVGFNPYSLWGVRHFLTRWRGTVPWNGEFYSRGRVGDWLSLLNFRILQEETFFMRLPISHAGLLGRTRLLERSQPMLGKLGGIYIIHARKQTIPMSMMRSKWRKRQPVSVVGNFVSRAHQRRTHDDKPDS